MAATVDEDLMRELYPVLDEASPWELGLELWLKPKFAEIDVYKFNCRYWKGQQQPFIIFMYVLNPSYPKTLRMMIGQAYGDDLPYISDWAIEADYNEWVNSVIAIARNLIHNHAIEIAQSLPIEVRRPKEEILAELEAASQEVDRLRARCAELAEDARMQDATWQEIGNAAGIKPQSAYQRWSVEGRQRHRDREAARRRGSPEGSAIGN